MAAAPALADAKMDHLEDDDEFEIDQGARMEKFNGRIYKKYSALKKREEERKADFQKLYNGMMDWVKDLHKEKEELCQKLLEKEDELKNSQTNFLEQIREKDQEIFRLNLLLAEKTDKSNSTTADSPNSTPEIILKNPTPAPPAKKTPQSNSRAKRARVSEEAIVPNSGSPEEEARELECSGSHACTTGNGANESSTAHMFHMLLESLVCMKISLNKETEEFSVSASHEASGYCFTLTWLEPRNEWWYKVSSLGNLEKVAWDWMSQDIKFHMPMCRMFFQKISDVIRKC